MTLHSLYPSYVEIYYELAGYGQHTMTRPTRAWVGTPWAGPGSYEAWDESVVSAAVMIDDWVDILLPIFTEDVTFTGYTIYTLSAPDADPVAVWADNFTGKVGTNIFAGQVATWQDTFTFLTEEGTLAKVVLLDCATGNVIKKTRVVSGLDAALVAEFTATDNAWSGRDDARPVALRSLSVDTNDALKRRYRL